MRALCIVLLLAVFCLPAPASSAPRGKSSRSKRKRARKKTPPPAPEAKAASTESAPSLRRSKSMEFDARLVQGERASGAVYLFQRVPRALPGLVDLSRRYADRITLPVLHRTAKPMVKAKTP